MKFKHIFTGLIFSLLLLFSCGSDDSDSSSGSGTGNEDCLKTPTDQVAKGNFMGTAFTSPGGSYYEQKRGDKIFYNCIIFTSPKKGGSCVFPDFENGPNTILFGLDSLEPQTVVLSDVASTEIKPTLTFNKQTNDGADIELSCGIIKIKVVDTDKNEITGSVIATGVDGSKIDGNFVLAFCDKDF